jgi:hypothetical protein
MVLPTGVYPTASHTVLQETALRRQIHAELTALRDALHTCPLDDPLTQELRRWLTGFTAAMRLRADAQEVLQTWIALLQRVLRDPLTQTPLDENPLLGSDGYTYGNLSLSVFLSTAPEERRHRSPIHPDHPAVFTTRPHDAARTLIRWLQRHGAHEHSQELESAYRALAERAELVPLPTAPRNEAALARILEIRTRNLTNRAQQAERLRTFSREQQATFHAAGQQLNTLPQEEPRPHVLTERGAARIHTLDELINDQEQQVERLRTGNQQLILEIARLEQEAEGAVREGREARIALIQAHYHRRQRENQHALYAQFRQLQASLPEHVEQIFTPVREQTEHTTRAALQRLAACVQTDQAQQDLLQQAISLQEELVRALEDDVRNLEASLQQSAASIASAQREDQLLQQEIARAQLAVEKHKSSSLGAFATGLALCGACAFSTWVIQSLILEMSIPMTGTLVPQAGGASLGLSFSL